MNFFEHFRIHIADAVAGLVAAGALPEGCDTTGMTVEPPREAAHGDLATNVAMVLARPAGMTPRTIADLLVPRLRDLPGVARVEVAGPGFINLGLDPDFWRARLADVLAAGADWGAGTSGTGRRVNVEYVSANPTGPMHVGHCRGAVFGDALCALLEKVGCTVEREYYINDAGAQVDVLARSAHLRYREALGQDVGDIPEGLYPGDYLVQVGRDLAARDGDRWLDAPEAEWLPTVRAFAIDAMMVMIRDDLARLGVRHSLFFSERSLAEGDQIGAVLATLQARGLVYEGVLEPPKGKLPDDWEERPQTLFRATEFGDDVDRPLRKSDGSWTYFAADIAYHMIKWSRGCDQLIDVWGADHGGYVKRVQAALAALTDGKGRLDVRLCQLVRLTRGGEPVRMSKRAGTFVTLREVVEEVGRDVVRFMMLMRKNDAALDFDFEKVQEQSKDNPVFYVQYAHARARSALRRAAGEGFATDRAALRAAPAGRLVEESEIALIRRLAGWPRLVDTAAERFEPHRIAFALYDLASEFHGLWNRGNDDPGLRFVLPDDAELTMARLALVQAVCDVIASGLAILGVTPAEEMR